MHLRELSFSQRGTAFDADDEPDDTGFFGGLFSDSSGCDGSCGGGGTGRSSTRARITESNGAGTSTSVQVGWYRSRYVLNALLTI